MKDKRVSVMNSTNKSFGGIFFLIQKGKSRLFIPAENQLFSKHN